VIETVIEAPTTVKGRPSPSELVEGAKDPRTRRFLKALL
jgi:hypothetical protein